jgi:hypothetical protein
VNPEFTFISGGREVTCTMAAFGNLEYFAESDQSWITGATRLVDDDPVCQHEMTEVGVDADFRTPEGEETGFAIAAGDHVSLDEVVPWAIGTLTISHYVVFRCDPPHDACTFIFTSYSK